MKPLSARQKEFLYREVAFGRFRWIAKPFYDGLMGLELMFHRFTDLFHRDSSAQTDKVTAVVKTFERPYAVRRLVKSIKRRYPKLSIIVIDDSRESIDIAGVEYVRMPYNTGISVGRNHALSLISTPYFLLLDDDFVFSHRQQLSEMIDYMDTYPQVDILGGCCIDLPLYLVHDFQDKSLFGTQEKPLVPVGSKIGDHTVVNKVQNYFIGRTETVRKVGWKPELKVNEHTEFFTRTCGQLTTGFHENMKILHAKTPFDLEYLKIRFARR